MPQPLITVIAAVVFMTPMVFAATPKEITQLYNRFADQKELLLKSDIGKKNAKQKVTAAYEALEKAMDEVKALESKSKDESLTSEGNQMAYDLEILSPLKDLVSGAINKEDCTKARHEHELNFPVVEDEDGKAILNLINKICSK